MPGEVLERRWIALGCGVLVVAGALWASLPDDAGNRSDPDPRHDAASLQFVGRMACADCHAEQQAAWAGSHHDLAMQEPTEATVLADFNDTHFTSAGITTNFFRRDGRFMVRTDGADGKLADFEIRYTFGVEPLQQYLIELPGGGRLQALSIAWDTRPSEQGGQRWFHLYPDQSIDHDDELHWTGAQQNWNDMCAQCHSTNLQRNFDQTDRSYATSWSEIDVSCEACHGPGSKHLDWARRGEALRDGDTGDKGLVVRLDERRDVIWTIDPSTDKPVRSSARVTNRELETCARCHSRRAQIADDGGPGRPLGDTHRVALLDAGLYYPDGQIRDEVFEYGSFLQSRMHQAGVTCSDCHEPHSLELRAPGDGVCLTCHQAAKYQAGAHHHHEPQSTGARCVECHMPGRNYMVVDHRRDHSLRIPRPDQAAAIGVPDVCTGCHRDREPGWAAAMLREWFGSTAVGLQRYAQVLHDGDLGAAGVRARLLGLAQDETQPGIARASALQRLDRIRGPAELAAVGLLLRDIDPLVRRAAVLAHQSLPAQLRVGLLLALDDPVLDVRLAAVPLVAEIAAESLQPAQVAAREEAIAEYVAAQQVNAQRPESHVNLGLLWAALGRDAETRAAFEQALSLDPRFVPAAVNLADWHRVLGQEREAESVLMRALEASPQAAALHHSLGLSLVRSGQARKALQELQRAADLAPATARYAYVYAVALEGAGRRGDAIRVLSSMLTRSPNDRDALWALATWQLQDGDRAAAAATAGRLALLEPDDPNVRALIERARQGP